MFGTYRTILALMVVAFHIGGVPQIGGYAVFGFYALSGYLMTFIMQKNYGYTPSGKYRYAINRMLRLYPMYWASALFTLILIAILGEAVTSDYHNALYLPSGFTETFKNILLFFPFRENPRLTPPAWALTVEIFFYILIGLGLSKHKKIVVGWFLLSIIYHALVIILRLGSDYSYYPIWAASLPFSTGALIFHFKDKLQTVVSSSRIVRGAFFPYLLGFFILFNWYIGRQLTYIGFNFNTFIFYSNFVLCALMIIVLAEKKSLPFISKKFDNWLGNFSYPIYLIHYQVGLVVLTGLGYLGLDYVRQDFNLMLITLPFLFGFSWLLILFIEKPIQIIRDKVKSKTDKKTANVTLGEVKSGN